MRNVPANLQAHLEGYATTLCWLWKITRRDGLALGFTDHDQSLVIDGLSYQTRSGLTPSEVERRLGFAIDNGAVQGALTSEAISAEDIKNGLYEDALIECFRVNWAETSQILKMSQGRLGAIRQKGQAFEAEWTGQAARLERSVGRVFSKICDAEFGDKRCGLNRANFPDGTFCPRTISACRNQFDNVMNYRGFPYLLGDDALQAAPQIGERRDGSSRYL